MALRFTLGFILGLLIQDIAFCFAAQTPTQSGQSVCLPLCQQKECHDRKGVLLTYHMIPRWIEAHALYIDSSRSTTSAQMTFNAGSVDHAALLRIPLVSAGVLDDSEPVTVEITAAHDTNIGKAADSDIRYGVSDGSTFVGFETCDKRNYGNNSPCYGIEGKSGPSLTAVKHAPVLPKPTDSHYPGQFVFTLKLDGRWGSCYTAHDGGFTSETEYNKRLMLSKGLSLEVYKSDKGERVGIKYIKVIITKDA